MQGLWALFLKAQSLAAHIESEHPKADQPEIF